MDETARRLITVEGNETKRSFGRALETDPDYIEDSVADDIGEGDRPNQMPDEGRKNKLMVAFDQISLFKKNSDPKPVKRAISMTDLEGPDRTARKKSMTTKKSIQWEQAKVQGNNDEEDRESEKLEMSDFNGADQGSGEASSRGWYEGQKRESEMYETSEDERDNDYDDNYDDDNGMERNEDVKTGVPIKKRPEAYKIGDEEEFVVSPLDEQPLLQKVEGKVIGQASSAKPGMITLAELNETPKFKLKRIPSLEMVKVPLSKKEKLKAVETERTKETINGKRLLVTKATNKRKLARFIIYFSYVAIIVLITAFALAFTVKRDTITTDSNANLDLSIDNCALHILDHADSSIQSPIYVKYQLPREVKAGQEYTINIDMAANPRKIEIKNALEPRYCSIKLYVKEGTPLDSLKITCPNCNITQDNSFQLEINGELSITGDVVHANFRNIKANSLMYDAITGHLQLNNIDISADSSINMKNEGDIIIQSTNDFKMDVQTNTQAFCFYGPLVTDDSSTNCAIAPSTTNQEATDCNAKFTICQSSGCTADIKTYTVVSNNGNVYANLIPGVEQLVLTSGESAKGQIYNDGIGFSPDLEDALNGFDNLSNDDTKSNPFIVLNVGNIQSKSAKYTKWILTEAPSYAYMRPWWIGTLSGTILNSYTEYRYGSLLPGFCPFYPQYSTEDLLTVQEKILSKIATETKLLTFVNDRNMPVPPTVQEPHTGVFSFAQGRNPWDKWFSLSRLSNGKISLDNNDYTSKGEILAAVILSLIIGAFISYSVLRLTIIAIDVMHEKLINFANHLQNYAKLDQSKAQKAIEDQNPQEQKKQPIIKTSSSFINIMNNSPSPSAFIDYLALIIYSQFSSSVSQYYQLLFKEADTSNDSELDPSNDMIKGTDAKVLYEKFCFMNHLIEQKLTDKDNINILKSYGFEIVTRNDLFSEVFTRMNIKNYDNFLIGAQKEDEEMSSLDIYMKENVDITQFQEDQVEVDTFIRIYHSFCDYNRLPRVLISTSLMKEKYDISVNFVPQQFIVRKPIYNEDFQLNYEPITWKEKLKKCLSKKSSTKTYNIDTTRLDKHFKLVMDKMTDLTFEEVDKTTADLIQFRGWIFWDMMTVFFHMLVGALLTTPLVILVVLNETQYEPWSLKDPENLIQIQDILRNPANVVVNVFTGFPWNIVIMAGACIMWLVCFLDIMLYYSVMTFPTDKSFKQSEAQSVTRLQRLGRRVEWILVFLSLAFYYGFCGVLLVWLLLGAFINPNAFLPFASAAVTFVVFVVTKYKNFKSIAEQGKAAVITYLKELFGGFINDVLDKLTAGLEKVTNSGLDKGKAIIKSDAFNNVTNQLVETGIVDPITVAQCREKLLSLEGKTIVAGGITVANNPAIIADELEKIALTLKQKVIEKAKEECTKRMIPPSLVNLIIAIALKDNANIKIHAREVIEECNNKVQMSQESINVVMELLFPQGVSKEDIAAFISRKIVALVFEEFGITNITGLRPEVFIDAVENFRNLQDLKLDSFVQGLKSLLEHVHKHYPLDEINCMIPILDIISILGKDKLEGWRVKDPALRLLNSAATLFSQQLPEGSTDAIQDFVQFLSIVSSGTETILDLKTKQPLKPNDILQIITNFCNSLKITDTAKSLLKSQSNSEMLISEKTIPHLIYLVIAYTRQEIHDIPKEITQALDEAFKLNAFGKNEYFSFCFDLANVIFNTPVRYYQRLNESFANSGLSIPLQNLFKVLTCYSMEDYSAHYSSFSIEKNAYFLKITESLKINPHELLGLIDIIYNKPNHKNADIFLTAILNRLGIKTDKLKTVGVLLDFFLSEDESTILHAVKALNLKHEQFLLIGKGILDPKFMLKEDFKSIGINNEDLLNEKNTIYNASNENYELWKNGLRKSISDEIKDRGEKLSKDLSDIENIKEYSKQEKQLQKQYAENSYLEFEEKANLINLYLSDWEALIFSRKSVSSFISILNNSENKLTSILSAYERGSVCNGIDFLTIILHIKELELKKGERYSRFDKEMEHSINILAEYLSVNAESLTKVIKLFVMDDQQEILECFFHFVPEERPNIDIYKRVLSYAFQQMSIVKHQVEFMTKKLPNFISVLSDKGLVIPTGIFEKIFFGKSKTFSISNLLELSYLAIRTFVPPEDQETALNKCYKVGLYIRGHLSLDGEEGLLKMDNRLLKLFKIFTETNHNVRLSLLTEMIDGKYHPLKLAIAFYGILTHQDFDIRHKKLQNSTSDENLYEEEPIRNYLANLFKVYPQVFDLFDVACERNITKFIQKTLPLLRRVNNSSFVDINLIETLFSLSLGERFNSNYLANRLEVSCDVIDFFVSMLRLALKQSRKKELSELSQSVPAKKVLAKLKIKPSELIAFIRLIFNLLENDAAVAETMVNLGIKKNDRFGQTSGESINLELFKGLATVNQPIEPSANVFENRIFLHNLRAKTVNFYNSLNVDVDNAMIISQLTAGNFLVIRENKKQLDWLFPTNDLQAETAIRDLTMAICGILNRHIEVGSDMTHEIHHFVSTFYPKNNSKFGFKEIEHKPTDKTLPNNSLSYAIYLTYHTMDIVPEWTQAFFFDKDIFIRVTKNLKPLCEEFILTIVLNFIYMSEFMRDYLGLYEWNRYCMDFCNQNLSAGLGPVPPSKVFTEMETNVYLFFAEKFVLEYEKTQELASYVSNLKDSYCKKIFNKNKRNFSFGINKSLFYLLTQDIESQNVAILENSMAPHFKLKTYQFLAKLALQLPKKEPLPTEHQPKQKEEDTEKIEIGKLIVQALKTCYNIVADNINVKDGTISKERRIPRYQRLRGYELTNLSMLGTIITLREEKIDYNYTLYNLNQLATNLERKLYLDDFFFRMSKFKLIKLAGVSLGIRISNLVEWCLPESLFTTEYCQSLIRAPNATMKKEIRISKCKKVVLEHDDRKNIVGDLGKLRGNYEKYNQCFSDLTGAGLEDWDWDIIKLLLNIPKCYVGDINIKNIETLKNLEKKDMFQACKTGENEVFYSKELVALVYDENYNAQNAASPTAAETKNRSKAKQQTIVDRVSIAERKKKENGVKVSEVETALIKMKEKTIDPKTGFSYKTLERRTEEFEWTLCSSNMGLIQSIINGDPSVLEKEGHVLSQKNQNSDATKIYKAIIGLQSFRKNRNGDRKLFKEYLQMISFKLESDTAKLEELLTFFITGKPILREIVNALEISDQLTDLLFMSIKEKGGVSTRDDEEEDEGDTKFSIKEAIQKTLDISSEDLEAFDIIRNIYKFKKKNGWDRVVEVFRKDSYQGSRKDKASKKVHPLSRLFEFINFKKLKREAGTSPTFEIKNFFTVPSEYKGDVFTMIFENLILEFLPDSNKQDKTFLVTAHKVIQAIINLDFSKLFEILVLSINENTESKPQDEALSPGEMSPTVIPEEKLADQPLGKILALFGIDPKNSQVQKDVRFIRVFLTMSSGDLVQFKKNKNYKKAIQGLLDDLAQTSLFNFLGDNKDMVKNIGQLFLGALAWDIEEIINAFITEKTLPVAYMLYHIYGCLKLNKIIMKEPDGAEQVKAHLNAFFYLIIQNFLPKSVINTSLMEEKLNLQKLMENEFSKEYYEGEFANENDQDEKLKIQRNLEILNKKSKKLFETIKMFDTNQSKQLLEHIMQKFSSSDLTNAFKDSRLEVVEIMISVCDGSILPKLLNYFIKDPHLKKFLWDLIGFTLKLAEKFFLPSGKNRQYDDILAQLEVSTKSLLALANNPVLDKVALFTPNIMRICLMLQGDSQKSVVTIKIEALVIVKKLISEIKVSKQKDLLFDLMSLVFGLTMQDFNEYNPGRTLKFDLGPGDRMELFFTKILPSLFPGLDGQLWVEDFTELYELIVKLKTDFQQSLSDPKKMREVAKDVMTVLKNFRVCNETFMRGMINLLEGNLGGGTDLALCLVPEERQSQVGNMLGYLEEVITLLNFTFANKAALSSNNQDLKTGSKKMNEEEWAILLKKIKEKTANNTELFRLLDEEGDRNGTVSEKEFATLAGRLGLHLSQHRIKEIFAKVKGSKSKSVFDQDLNEQEFVQAMEYLESKNLLQTLELLGITPEMLTAIFIKLIILLILIFIFIFLGIRAFAIGGTFGALINSAFPAIGGFGLSREKDISQDKVQGKSVEKAATVGFEITTSEQL